MALIKMQAALKDAVLAPVPTAQSVALAHDKLELGRFAAGLGIGIPQTWCPADRREVESIGRQIDFPCVLKLRRGAGAIGLSFPRSAAGLLDDYDKLPRLSDDVFTADRPLIQEFIPGGVHDACMLFNRGEPRAAFTQQRLLMHPETGGVGIYNQSTDQPEIREKAERLLRALAWHGPAMVEFKRDERDGVFKLLEINARYWDTLGLAIRAGVDFPWLACRMAVDGDIEPVTRYRVGLKYRWSCRYGARYVRRSESKLAAFKKFYAPGDGSVSDCQWTDPLPDLLMTIGGFSQDRQ
jgi:predicted ATP-grasp superfamily ATP-dependent carboligase